MPQIKIERVISFSSEDPTHVANNVLLTDPSKKWKCKTVGEKSASVVLQLDQPYVINSIDIGNENSAYIEVLVARSTSPEDYKVLLVMSSFMSPLEARQTQNVNKVRMFKTEDLSDPEKNEKWDRIKIVCTQPFNRHVQYGLSFINLYSSNGKVEENQSFVKTIGKFTVRPESPDNISIGSLFAKKKQEATGEKKLSGAAAIREATSLAHSGSPASKQWIKHNLPSSSDQGIQAIKIVNDDNDEMKKRKDRNRNELLYSKDEEDKHSKIDKLIEKRDAEKAIKEKEREQEKAKKKLETPLKHRDKKPEVQETKKAPTPNTSLNTSKTKGTSTESQKRKHEDTSGHESKKQRMTGKAFDKLLEGVVLVISGIQNPDRANLRTMALSMGAKYKPDWDNNCTHLICAFANTPKFNQVKGKGKIVTRKWIEDCYKKRKRLPWRRYALDKGDLGPESEEEIWEIAQHTQSPEPIHDIDSDRDLKEEGSDTDDKIESIRAKQSQNKPSDEYSIDTDSEILETNIERNTKFERTLKHFLRDKIFYVDENLNKESIQKIQQYIVAYDGILRDTLNAGTDIIVTNKTNFKALKEACPVATCVAPDWIWDCHNQQKLVSMRDFIYE